MDIPYHIAIIMDGNGRWAKERGLPRTAGHKQGIKRVKEIVREAKRLGVNVLTVFTFSTENWNRPKREIRSLFSYLSIFLDTYQREVMKEDIRVKVIGRRDRISKRIVRKIEKIEELTANNGSFLFIVSLDYGGKWDIVQAVKKIIKDWDRHRISIDDIDETTLRKYLCLSDIPDPDLLIRTSGEQRISNFMLWNLAYSEFYFPKVYWPDFNKQELIKAIEVYGKRKRKFGRV